MPMPEQDVEKWVLELTDAGWKRIRMDIWKAPNGALFRGPYAAWRMMKSVEQWGGEPLGQTEIRLHGRRRSAAAAIRKEQE